MKTTRHVSSSTNDWPPDAPRGRRLSLSGSIVSGVLVLACVAAAFKHYCSSMPSSMELVLAAPQRPVDARPDVGFSIDQAAQVGRPVESAGERGATVSGRTYFATAFEADFDREVPITDSPVVLGAFPGAGRSLLQFLPNAWAASDRRESSLTAAIATKGFLRRVPTGRSAPCSIAYSPDARYIAIAAGGRIRLWDVGRGLEVRRLAGHDGPVWSVDWSDDGRSIAAVGSDGTVRLWDAIEVRPTGIYRSHRAIASVVAFSPDSTRVASGADDGTIAVTEPAKRTTKFLSGHQGAVLALAFLGTTDRLATVGADGTLRTWDAVEGTLLATAPLDSLPLCMETLRDGTHVLTGHEDGRVDVRDAVTGRVLRSLPEQGEAVLNLAMASDGTRLATATADGRVRLWSLADGRLLATNEIERAKPTCLAFVPDGTGIACGGVDEFVRVWNPPARR